ncbi:ATP-dependent sacrificial sulfur transferase LarE, partial [bacterium]
AKELGVAHFVIETTRLGDENIAKNPPDRCYHCKKAAFSKILELAAQKGYRTVMDGTNADDAKEHRPGKKALGELSVLSPLALVGLTKAEIRLASRRMGLSTWDRQAQTCFATRFPYGTNMTKAEISRVAAAEDEIRRLGFSNLRVRCHGDIARLELPAVELLAAVGEKRELISTILKRNGFKYSTIDLDGYRFGSMDE